VASIATRQTAHVGDTKPVTGDTTDQAENCKP